MTALRTAGVANPAQGATLEFGCGAGRVLLPMRHFHRMPTHGCDINHEQIAFLQERVPEVDLRTTPYDPPTDYGDATFDLIYAISIWTHMYPTHQVAWLEEMKRILKPGGILALTVSGHAVLATRGDRPNDTMWDHADPSELDAQGILHVDYDPSRMGKRYDVLREKAPNWGRTLQTEEYTRRVFGGILDVVSFMPHRIGKVQDLVILRKASEQPAH
jgi:SAM-dependent methyltransferase